MLHYKYGSENIDEFYRCCFVPIENQMIIGNGEGISNEDRSTEIDKL